jgi:hypothetical protein
MSTQNRKKKMEKRACVGALHDELFLNSELYVGMHGHPDITWNVDWLSDLLNTNTLARKNKKLPITEQITLPITSERPTEAELYGGLASWLPPSNFKQKEGTRKFDFLGYAQVKGNVVLFTLTHGKKFCLRFDKQEDGTKKAVQWPQADTHNPRNPFFNDWTNTTWVRIESKKLKEFKASAIKPEAGEEACFGRREKVFIFPFLIADDIYTAFAKGEHVALSFLLDFCTDCLPLKYETFNASAVFELLSARLAKRKQEIQEVEDRAKKILESLPRSTYEDYIRERNRGRISAGGSGGGSGLSAGGGRSRRSRSRHQSRVIRHRSRSRLRLGSRSHHESHGGRRSQRSRGLLHLL